MLQIRINLQIICLGSFYKAVDGRTGFGTVDGIHDMPVGSANGERPNGPLCCGVVDGDIPILQEDSQVLLLVYTVV